MFSRAARWSLSRLSLLGGGAPDAAPRAVPAGCEELVEGLARVIFRTGEVFYNPVQVVNRDLSVLMLRWLQRERNGRDMRVLEALSATGLRAIRYAREVPGVTTVLANDLDPGAVQTIARNVVHNGGAVVGVVVPNCGDAINVMTSARMPSERFDVVDLDPYGGAAIFLDSAVQAVSNGGLLAVTCTDLAVLCGNMPEACFARYGATPLKCPATHEMAVRIVLSAINAAANRHGRSVEVLLCVKIDFYVRLFVRIRDSKAATKLSQSRTSAVYMCSSCGTQRFQPFGRIEERAPRKSKKRRRKEAEARGGAAEGNADSAATPTVLKFCPAPAGGSISDKCSICEGKMLVGGPIWTGPLADTSVCESILNEIDEGEGAFQARDRVSALVRVAAEEVPDAPLFMQMAHMASVLKTSIPPSAAIRTALTKRGYKVSQSHTDSLAMKTDAPPEFLWDLLRLWVKSDLSGRKTSTGKAAKAGADKVVAPDRRLREKILSVEPTLVREADVDFSIKKDEFVRGHHQTGAGKDAPRFPINPEANWGPKSRAQPRKRQREDKI